MSVLTDLAVAGFSTPQIQAIQNVGVTPADLVAAGFTTAQAEQILADLTPADDGNGYVQQGLWFGTQAPALVAYLND